MDLLATTGIDLIRRELDRWYAKNLVAPFWWRDDDASANNDPFRRLIQLAESAAVPLVLAVSPMLMEDEFSLNLRSFSHACIAAHGYSHTNHRAGKRKAEFGPDRPLEEMRDEIDKLAVRFAATFPECGLAMFVPPWHAFDSRLVPDLVRVGFTTLSMYETRISRGAALVAAYAPMNEFAFALTQTENSRRYGAITRLDCSVDLLGSDGPGGTTVNPNLVRDIFGALVARRVGITPANRPIGIMTHHMQHDDVAWALLERVVTLFAEHPAARFIDTELICQRFRRRSVYLPDSQAAACLP
jgi:hypothetical protein